MEKNKRNFKNKSNKKNKYKRRKCITLIVLASLILLLILFIAYKLGIDNGQSNFLYNNTGREVENSLLEDNLKVKVNIIEVPLKWNMELEEYNVPEKIIIHHGAIKNATVEEIHNGHLKRGFGGIGYNYYIRKDGTIYKGRDEKYKGAHTLNENGRSIGICLEGNYEEENPSKAQLENLINLTSLLVVKYNVNDVVGHRECGQTLCPGKNINIDSIREEIILKLRKAIE